jgi:hypothetical protein
MHRKVSAINLIKSWTLPSFADDNGFAYFSRNEKYISQGRSNRRLKPALNS